MSTRPGIPGVPPKPGGAPARPGPPKTVTAPPLQVEEEVPEEVATDTGEDIAAEEEIVTRPPTPFRPGKPGQTAPKPGALKKPAPRPDPGEDEGDAPGEGKASVVDMILAIVALLVVIALSAVLFMLKV